MTILDKYGNLIAETPGARTRTAMAPVDMNGFPVRNAGSIGLAPGQTVTAVPGGVLKAARSTVVLDVPGGAAVEAIEADRVSVGLLLLVNAGPDPVTLRSSDALRLYGGFDRDLQRGAMSFLVQAEPGVWQEISGDPGLLASAPALVEAAMAESAAPIVEAAVGAAMTGRGVGYQFASIAALLADATLAYGSGARAVAAGDIIEAGGHRYEVAASGASDHHLTTAGGVRVYVRPGADGLYNLAAFGADLDGISDDTSFCQIAIDAGLPVLINSERVRLGTLSLRSGTRLVSLRGTEIVSTSNLFRVGNVGYQEANDLTYHTLAATTAGATSVTTSTASDAGGYAVDDMVFLRGSTFYTSGGEDIYDWSAVNRVVSADAATGLITLAYPLDEGHSTARIANITQSGINGVVTGTTLFATEGVVVEGFSVTTTGKLFDEGGGTVNSRFRFKSITCDSFAYNNAFCRSEISAQSVEFARHFFELALASHDNRVDVQAARLTTNPVAGKIPVRYSEGTRGNRIRVQHMDLTLHANGDVPLSLLEGRRNDLDIGTLRAPNATSRLFTFGAQSFTPTPPKCEDNRLRIGQGYAGAGDRYGIWSVSGGQNARNVVHDSRFFGAVSSGRAFDLNGTEPGAINVWCEDGSLYVQSAAVAPVVRDSYFPDDFDPTVRANLIKAPGIRGVTSDGWRLILGQAKNDQATTVTATTSAASSSQSIPAGALMIGDVLRFEASGFVSGANDAKTVELWIGGSRVVSIPFAAAETGDWMFSGYARVQSLTNLRFAFNIGSDAASAVRLNTGSLTVADLSANALAVELRAWRPNVGDTLSLNGLIATAERAGR